MNDNELFCRFYRRHGNALLGYARKCAYGDEQDAADGVQECLVKICDKILDHLRVHGDQDCPGWLWNYVGWHVIDVRRKRLGWSRRDHVVRVIPTAPEELAALQDGDCESSQVVADWEAALTKAFQNCRPPLSETEKAVLRLTILEEPPLSDAEASVPLGTSAEAIKVRRCSGLRKLREFLNPDGKGRPADLI